MDWFWERMVNCVKIIWSKNRWWLGRRLYWLCVTSGRGSRDPQQAKRKTCDVAFSIFSSCAKLNYQKLLESTVFCRILIYVERKCNIGNAGSCQAVGPRRFSSLLASGSCFLNRTPRNRKKPLSACSIVASGCIAAILADVDGGGHDDIPLQIVMIDEPYYLFDIEDVTMEWRICRTKKSSYYLSNSLKCMWCCPNPLFTYLRNDSECFFLQS